MWNNARDIYQDDRKCQDPYLVVHYLHALPRATGSMGVFCNLDPEGTCPVSKTRAITCLWCLTGFDWCRRG